jgi:hypothetical protein
MADPSNGIVFPLSGASPFVVYSNGADASLMATITVTDNSGTPNDGIVCTGGSATLTANLGDSYAWSTGATTQAIPVNPVTTTTYTVTVTIGGTPTTASTTITVSSLPTAGITVVENSGTPNNGTICQGFTASLTGTGGTSYVWSTGANTTSINVITAGTYTVIVSNAAGCTSTSSTTITVLPLPTPGITVTETSGLTANDGILCTGDNATLTATGGGTYAWSTGANTAGISVNATGTYTVTVTGTNGCSATTSRSITVRPVPIASIDRVVCRNEPPVNLNASWAPEGISFSGPGVVGNVFTASSVPNDVSNLLIQVNYECPVQGLNTLTDKFNVNLRPTPVANLKETLSDCLAPGQTINLQNMFDGSNSTNGTFTISPSLTITGTNIAAPANGGCYNVTYTASNPDGCTGAPFTDQDQLLITIQPEPAFTISGPNNLTVCQAGGNVAITVNRSSTGANPVLTVNGNPQPLGTPINLAAPANVGSVTYTICLKETINTPAACGTTLPGGGYTPCEATVCKTIVIYNDGLCGTNDAPFPSECDPNLDDPIFEVCPVETSPYFMAGCAFISVTIPYKIVEANITADETILFCSDPETTVDFDAENVFSSIPGFSTPLSDLPGVGLICDVLNFCICIDFLDIEWRPLGALGTWCNQTLADFISDAVVALTNSGGSGGLIVADTDGDGAFDYVVKEYYDLPESGNNLTVPNNISKSGGIITVRHLAGWPFRAESACGNATINTFNLLDAVEPFLNLIPIAGPIIVGVIQAASCDIPIAFTDANDVQIPVINDVPPVFVNCPQNGYVISEDNACAN